MDFTRPGIWPTPDLPDVYLLKLHLKDLNHQSNSFFDYVNICVHGLKDLLMGNGKLPKQSINSMISINISTTALLAETESQP